MLLSLLLVFLSEYQSDVFSVLLSLLLECFFEYQSDVFSVLLSLLLECFLVNISLMYLVCCYLYC